MHIVKKYIVTPVVAAILVVTNATSVLAFDEAFFSANNILYYNPDNTCGDSANTLSSSVASTGSVKGNIKISTANLPSRNSSGFDSSMRILAEPSPDFITLNEVKSKSLRAIEAAAPGYKAYRDPTPDNSPGGTQAGNNAVMWRTDKWKRIDGGREKTVDKDQGIHNGQAFTWSRYADWGTFQNTDGEIMSVISTHMPTNPGKFPKQPPGATGSRIDRYATGMDNLILLVGKLATKGPVVIGGDMNSHPDQGEWTAAAKMKKAGYSYTKDQGVMYLFFQNQAKVIETHQKNVSSDHPALFTTLNLSGAGGGSTTQPSITPGAAGQYKNPLFKGTAPDPAIIKADDGTYYAYATGNNRFSSKDLVNWKKDNAGWNLNKTGGSGDIWAPDVAKVGDKYILTYALISGVRTIHYAVGDNASGPFTYKGRLGGLATDYLGTIDPHIFVDGGKTYLFYGGGRIFVKEMSVSSSGDITMKGGSTELLNKASGPLSSGNYTLEGSWVQKKDDWYYLYYSYGQWQAKSGANEYSVGVARSKNVTGPYEPKNLSKIILRGEDPFRGPGHNSTFRDGAGNDWIVYHAWYKGDRSLMMDPITYEDGWPVIGDGRPSSGGQAPTTGTATAATSVNDCTCQASPTTSTISLTGNDNIEKAFNFFVAKGLSDTQSAGIIGNMMQESGIDPENIQDPAGRTKDPTGISAGWGIIQWTPADPKVFNSLEESGARGEIYELGTQLEIVWGHLNGKPPITTGQFKIDDYKKIDSLEDAVLYFEKHIEGAGTPVLGNRITYAEKALEDFGNGNNGATGANSASPTTSSDGCASSTTDLGTGIGDFTEGGSVNGWETVQANAIAVNKAHGDSMVWKGKCAGIVARTWMGKNSGFGYAPHYAMTLVKDHKGLVHSGSDKNQPKSGSILLLGGSTVYGHVVIYLGNNKVLNDGFITDAADVLEGREYYGWTDPNDLSWSKPSEISDSDAQALKSWVGL